MGVSKSMKTTKFRKLSLIYQMICGDFKNVGCLFSMFQIDKEF